MDIRNKVGGCIYGMALGDAMGMPSELWSRKRINKFFPDGIKELLDGPKENDIACNYNKGQFTDDTSQALIILDSIGKNDFQVLKSDIAKRFIQWAEKENAFENNILGPTSKLALASIMENKDPIDVTSKALSNGSAMRIAPIGCLFLPEEKEKLVNFVYEVSSVTHSSDIAIAGASIIAQAVSTAICYDDFDRIINDVFEVEKIALEKGADTYSAKISERIKIGIGLAKKHENDKEKFSQSIYDIVGSGVSLIESVPAAISIAYFCKDPNKSAIMCANLGGDTDTIGAMATSICGAYRGLDSINEEYITILKNQNPDTNFESYVDLLIEGRNVL